MCLPLTIVKLIRIDSACFCDTGHADARQGGKGSQQRSVEEASKALPGTGEEIQRFPGVSKRERVVTITVDALGEVYFGNKTICCEVAVQAGLR